MVEVLRQFEFRAMAVLLRIGENEATGIKESRLAATAVLKACERIAARDFPSPPSNAPTPTSPPRRHSPTPAPADSPQREPGRREPQSTPQTSPSAERPQLSTSNRAGGDASSVSSLHANESVRHQPPALATAIQQIPNAATTPSIPSPSHRITVSPYQTPAPAPAIPSSLRADSPTPPTRAALQSPTLPILANTGNPPRQPITYPSAARTEPLHPRPP